MQPRICLLSRTYGNTPGWDLTWLPFPAARECAGPQNAGLLLGKKHLTDLAQQNNNPEDGVGRGMKVAKEQIVGMVAAVDWVLSHTEESMQGDYQKRADLIAAAVKGIPSVTTRNRCSQDRQPCTSLADTLRSVSDRRHDSADRDQAARGPALDRTQSQHWTTTQPGHSVEREYAGGRGLDAATRGRCGRRPSNPRGTHQQSLAI